MRAVLTVLAKIEHKKIVTRTQSGRRRRAEAGRLFFARYGLFGYERVEGPNGKYEEYVIDEWAANIVRRIVSEVRSGKPLRQICQDLDRDGISTPASYALKKYGLTPPKNKKAAAGWQNVMITRIIYNPSYCGERFTGMFKTTKEKSDRDPVTGFVTWIRKQQRRKPGDEGTWKADPTRCPAIVSKEDLLAAQARLEQNRQEAKRNSIVARDELALLRAGYVVCGHCGRKMISHRRVLKSGQATAYYSCDRTWVARDRGYDDASPAGSCAIMSHQIDGLVWDHVVRLLTEPEVLEEALARVRGEAEQRQADVEERGKALEAAIVDARMQMENLERSLGHATNPKVQARIVGLIEEQAAHIAAWEAELEDLEQQEVADADAQEACASLLAWGRALEHRLGTLSYQEKRDVLYGLGIEVGVYKQGHDPRYEVTADFAGIRAGWRGDSLRKPSDFAPLMVGTGQATESGARADLAVGASDSVTNNL